MPARADEEETIKVHDCAPKCLILAAGTGRRMKSFKPLVQVAGLPLIERVIVRASEAGLSDFFVVTGHEAERLEAFLAALSRRRGLRITTMRNSRWEEANGLSLLQAREAIGEDEFVLLMGDHVVEKSIIESVLNETMDGCDVVLAVDSGIAENRRVDLDDVTRVKVDNDRIVAIGKGLLSFNAFDTGVFRCHPALFAAAETCAGEGRTSLSDAVRHLAAQHRVKALDVSGRFWIDVDTRADARQAEGTLRSDLGKPQDGYVSRVLNRPISTRMLTPLLLRLRSSITPNQVSLLGFVVSLLACASFFLHLPVLGGFLIHLASLLDGSDGEVARLKKAQSRFGGFFDAVLDRYGDGFILFSLFYYTYTSPAIASLLGTLTGPIVSTAAILALSGNFMVSYTSAKSVTDFGYEYRGGWLASGRGRDLRLFVLAIGALGAAVHPMTVLVALGFVAAITSATVVGRTWISWEHAQGRATFGYRPRRAVILDFDGTVANTMGYLSDLAVGLISRHYAVPPPQALTSYLETTGMDFAGQMELMFAGHASNSSVVAEMEERKRCGLIESSPFADVVPTLRFFQAHGIRVFICSSTRQDLVQEFVSRAGLADLIDAAYGYAVGMSKDRQIQSILHEHAFSPSEAVFVGDSFADADFARMAGVPFIGLARMFPAAEFDRRGIFSVSDLLALTRLWQRWNELLSFRQPANGS
jgi:choline kinase/phosphoglycolate phosphatase-like HAD superfamily hydrolase/phosphatidylglycerophosphate synthase